jgi:hypothetical protein
MMATLKKNRPNCEQLLVDKKIWALNISDIENYLMEETFKQLSTEKNTIEQNFCNYFIRTKLMHD